jgi:pSer/pThr/pTyr-binding forkhead associated (FHA) protein
MILCPNCHHQEIIGALFCSECGAQIVMAERVDTQLFRRNASEQLTPSIAQNQAERVAPQAVGDATISLYLEESGQVIHLSGRSEFTLGRVTEGQPILPDVDLSSSEAYTQGVSRLHACLKISNQNVTIADLGSSNGTRVNGQKITMHVDYPLNHGDWIALGKLKIQILIRR